MKINQVAEDVERGNVSQERGFSIQANARAFQILSSNLYADKITAVIRELSCNALDSHVAAHKQTVPFDVHLPTALEPYFSVQDYGLGLSHLQVMNIYTTYFESTKTNTNELIGGLGLGSKSPFSYTSSFDVTSVYQGVSRSYAMFINESGKPSVAFMGEITTHAPNGVCVRMPVKSADFAAFREKAARVFKWFSHPPVVSGVSNFKIPELSLNNDIKGTDWALQNDERLGYSYNRAQAVALMGNVAYPIKANVIKDKFHYLLSWPLVIYFGIGDLDISASREDLSYDDVTVEVIESKLNKIMAELEQRIKQKFVEANTLWEARLLLASMTTDRTLCDILYAMKRGGFKVLWQGQEVTNDYIHWYKMFKGIDPQNPTIEPDPAPGVYDVSTYSRARMQSNVTPSSKAVFILKDVSDASSRCKLVYYQIKNTAYLIEGALDSNAAKCAQVARLLKHLGDPPTILASSLPKPPKKAMKFKGMVWSGKASSWRPRKIDNWSSETELTTNQGGYYCTLSGLEAIVGSAAGEDRGYNLGTVINCAEGMGIINKDDKVWGINKTNSRLVKEETNWKNIYHHVREKVVELIANTNVAAMVHARQQSDHIGSIVYTNVDHWVSLFGSMPNAMGEFARAWHTASTVNSKISLRDLRELAHVFGISLDDKVTNQGVDLIKLYYDAVKAYPLMVKFVRDHIGDQHWNLLKDYVNLVDTVSN